MTVTSPRVTVIGGGLAGLSAALSCIDAGASVTLLERRKRLGGLTWSFTHNGIEMDNGQHVFLRCCHEYLSFLRRIGSAGDVEIQSRLDIPVHTPASDGRRGRLRRSGLPAPAHLARSLMAFPFLSLGERLRLGQAVVALQRLDLEDPRLDDLSFADWLEGHGQSVAAIESLWDLITVPTVNLPCRQASLAMGAMVFKTALLGQASAADIGWSRIPLGTLHGTRGYAALEAGGAEIRSDCRVNGIEPGPFGFRVGTDSGPVDSDAVILAAAHEEAAKLAPPGIALGQERWAELGSSAIVDVHLVFDRKVTDEPIAASHGSAVQWIFDRTAHSGVGSGQYLALSLSAADDLVGRHPDELISWITAELAQLLPTVQGAKLLESLVTKERRATFSARPGTGWIRPVAATAMPGLALAGSWTRTGWPATMEGAVRSGRSAAREVLATIGGERSTVKRQEVA